MIHRKQTVFFMQDVTDHQQPNRAQWRSIVLLGGSFAALLIVAGGLLVLMEY